MLIRINRSAVKSLAAMASTALGAGVDDILRTLPAIRVDGAQVDIISDPTHFYERLNTLAARSTRRIVVASLYVGNGPLERQLVECIGRSNATRVRVLIDHSRGCRQPQSSCQVLLPLFTTCTDARVHLYHTPALRGWLRRLLPARWNEVVGLQHMKVYIFDDTTVITGANMSETYFTNRQDRCVIVNDCRALADVFDNVVDAVASCSMQMSADGTIDVDPRCDHHPVKGADTCAAHYVRLADNQKHFMASLRQRLTDALAVDPPATSTTTDTTIHPFVQYGDCDMTAEQELMSSLLALNNRRLTLYLASGYFNLLQPYTELIANVGTYGMTLMAASPMANGFFGAGGLAGWIPHLYSCAARQFVEQTAGVADRVRLLEYDRPGWTYHAKGLWLSHTDDTNVDGHPFATVVGSSNYGYRSCARDMECGVLLHTSNVALRRRLHDERSHLMQYCQPMPAGDAAPFWLRFVFKFARRFF